MSALFYEHGIVNILINVALALSAPLSMWSLRWMIRRAWKRVFCFFMAWVTLLFSPNAMYLTLEFRHVLQKDNVVDNHELFPVAVFSLLSLFGLALTLWTIRMGITLPLLRDDGADGGTFESGAAFVCGKRSFNPKNSARSDCSAVTRRIAACAACVRPSRSASVLRRTLCRA